MSEMLVAGVDPGNDGAVCVIRDGKPHKMALLNSITLRTWLEAAGVKIVFFEKAQSMGRESAKAMFSYGRNYGYLLGTLVDRGFDVSFVPPVEWTRWAHQKSAVAFDSPKAASLYVARTMWPDVDWRATPRSRSAHDGLVDAALIGMYGWLKCSKKL